MLVMPLRWARMAPTIAATWDSARPPGIGTVGIPSICAGIFPAVMPMRSIVLQNCLNRSWDGFSSAMASSSPVGGPRAGANSRLGPRRRRLLGVEDGEETVDAAAESGPDVGGAVEVRSGHGSVAHHEEVLRGVLGLASAR